MKKGHVGVENHFMSSVGSDFNNGSYKCLDSKACAFSLLGIRPVFAIDPSALNEAYFTRQILAHPDRYVCQPDSEQAIASRESSSLNQAYKILKNPVLRARELFKFYGLVIPGENEKGEEQSIQDIEILSEVMELQEMAREAALPEEYKILEYKLFSRLKEVMACLTDIFDTNQSPELRLSVFQKKELNSLYLRLNYLSKIKKDIKFARQLPFAKSL
jgi:molecular chaperone HscB